MIYPAPKPKGRKQRKAVNNKMPTADDICTFPGCSRGYAHNHEVFFGKNRQNSIKYKMQKRLCSIHHQGSSGPHKNIEYDLELKRVYQKQFEEEYSRDLFVEVFGKSYL